MNWMIVGMLIGLGLMLAPVVISFVVVLGECLFVALAWAVVGTVFLVPRLIIPLIVTSPLFPDPGLPLSVAAVFTVLTLFGWLAIKVEAWKEKRRQAHNAQLYRPSRPFVDPGRGPLTPGELDGSAWRS